MSSVEHLIILFISILANYIFAKMIEKNIIPKINLILIILLNLLPLIYYKYNNMFYSRDHNIVLPLAISFFTFQQIAFQTDIYRKKEKTTSFKDYIFFVLFFPQLVAGPIIHYRDLIPQVYNTDWGKYREEYFNIGLMLFSIGLFKKVVIADNLAPIANLAFGSIETLSIFTAWQGVLAYTMQIYFDFSGYSDMAIGLALFFGIKLPINFNSPYKATNLIEFWRAWHITLSSFLKEHIYIPLGGNRVNSLRVSINLMTTMLIGGIWHGSGLNFLVWGGLHGILLILLHFIKKRFSMTFPKIISISITFLSVSLLWVLFRADSLNSAIQYYQILFNFHSISQFNIEVQLLIIIFPLILVWFFPNSIEISQYLKSKVKFKWYHSAFASLIFFISLKSLATSPAKTFVYFNF
jgi:D-alanyl-lipoteichoic acid acyltransferase DltB (MBOAT superfamily)